MHVMAPKNFGQGSEFWDLDYKIEHTFDHVAKFHGDRPRELTDFALKKNSSNINIKYKTCLCTGCVRVCVCSYTEDLWSPIL